MVTYRIEGLPDRATHATWLLMFEDLAGGGDRDYNDLVVEVKAIPLPPALWPAAALLAGLAGVCALRSVRRRTTHGA
jgi:hypothetical protein